MSNRTFLRQSAQIKNSDTYNDSIPVTDLQNQTTLEGDLNALRTQANNILGVGKWDEAVPLFRPQPLFTFTVAAASLPGAPAAIASGTVTYSNKTAVLTSYTYDPANSVYTFQISEWPWKPMPVQGSLVNLSLVDGADTVFNFVNKPLASAVESVTGTPVNLSNIETIVNTVVGDYLPLSGGTLTGALSGDIASFVTASLGDVTAQNSLTVVGPTTVSTLSAYSAAVTTQITASSASVSGLLSGGSVKSEGTLSVTGASTLSGNVTFEAGATISATPTNVTDVANKGYVDDVGALKVSKSGDTMSGALDINVGIDLTALSLTALGQALQVSSPDGLVFEVNTELSQISVTKPGAGESAVLSQEQLSITGNDATINESGNASIYAGTISLTHGGQAAWPVANDHVTTKKYVDDTRVAKSGDTMTGALVVSAQNLPTGQAALQVNDGLVKINGGGLLPALDVTGEAWFRNNAGEKVVEIEAETYAINVQVPEVDASQLGYFTTSTMAGQITVAQQNGSYSASNLAFTDINPGFIALWESDGQGGLIAATPTSPEQVATKQYVDGLANGLAFKAPVKARLDLAANTPIPTGSQTVDGVGVVKEDRVLVVSADATLSGIYVVDAINGNTPWARAADYAAGIQADGTYIFVQQGQTYANTSWVQIDTAIVGTDALNFVQFDAPTNYYAGAGLELSQGSFSIKTGGVETSMLAAGAVTTAKLADSAVTNDKIADGTITEAKLAFAVYTESEVDSALALKLDLAGGTMSGNIAMGGNAITGLVGPVNDADAATKKYVDDVVSGVSVRGTKTYTVLIADVAEDVNLTAQSLTVPLPSMAAGNFLSDYDVYVNGQLNLPGANANSSCDYYPGTDLFKGELTFNFDLKQGDILCVVSYV